jgi:hypothetical protein
MDVGDLAGIGLIGVVAVAVLFGFMSRTRRQAAHDTARVLPNPLADSPAVAGTLAALGPQLAPGGAAGWLVVVLGTEQAAAEALVASLQPGLPEQGPFAVNRLVGQAPVRLTGHVHDGVPVVTSVEKLGEPDSS